jgi:Domain of unknown function (DUF5666)
MPEVLKFIGATNMTNPKRRGTCLALLACLVTACGGGGNNTVSAPPVSAAAKSAVVTGTITSFGSVHVNGVHFDTSNTKILKNGRPATQAELRVGQVVSVKGSVDDKTGQGAAESITQDNSVEGAIESIDLTAKTFVVAGQTVKVDGNTSFDDSINPAGIDGLKVKTQVEVSGMTAADGTITATRIELRDAPSDELEVMGTVAALDTTAHTFKINDLAIDYSAARLENFGAASIQEGDLVEAQGNSKNSAGALVASKVELKTGEPSEASHEDRRELEGLVTRFASKADFDVADHKVTTNDQTVFKNGTADDLKQDVRVEVEGQLDANGTVVASKIEFRHAGVAAIAWTIDSVDKTAGTITVLGSVIAVDATTRLEDKSSAKIERFSINDLNQGDFVVVRGVESGGNKLKATRLERRAPSTEALLRGTVSNAVAPQFTILGVTVQTDANTQFEIGDDDSASMSADQFFAGANGQIASVKGTVTGTVLTAKSVRISENDSED